MRLSVFLCFVFLIGHAQKENKTGKTLQTNADRIHLQFSEVDRILIESSDKDFIEVVAVNQFGGFSGITLEETNNVVLIKSVPTPKQEEKEFKSCGIQPDFCNYEIKIPDGKTVFLQAQEGNIGIQNFKGVMHVTLEKGMVGLKNCLGELEIQIQVGNIYSDLNNVKFEIETRLGNIFVNELVVPKENEMSRYSGVFGKPVSSLLVKATHANIYMKEVK